MARTQVYVRGALERAIVGVPGCASLLPEKKEAAVYEGGLRHLVGKREAASPAATGAGAGHLRDLMAGGKNRLSAREDSDARPQILPAMASKAAPPGSEPAGIGSTWEASRSLVAVKSEASAPAGAMNRQGSLHLLSKRADSPPASFRPRAGGAASPHKRTNAVFVGKREAPASRPLTAKAGASWSPCTSKARLQIVAKANKGFAAGRLDYIKALSPNKGQKRGASLVFLDPRKPSLQKKVKLEPADLRRVVQRRLRKFRQLAVEFQRKKARKPHLEAFKSLKERGRTPSRKYLGEVPGVDVGDEFSYRVELMVAGLHGSPFAGIDSTAYKGERVATCVVSQKFKGYANVMMGSDVLVYSGEGGNLSFERARKGGPPGDQRLERGNLALKNSMNAGTPVRVVHGFRVPRDASESLEARDKMAVKYVYDGLYMVEDFWWETGRMGFRVLKFQMRRLPGQPKLELKQVLRSRAAHESAVALPSTTDGTAILDTQPSSRLRAKLELNSNRSSLVVVTRKMTLDSACLHRRCSRERRSRFHSAWEDGGSK